MSGTVTLAFAVSGMHCASCGLLIDDTVEDLQGVRRSQTDRRRGRTIVVADHTLSPAQVVAAIAEAGYHAELVPTP